MNLVRKEHMGERPDSIAGRCKRPTSEMPLRAHRGDNIRLYAEMAIGATEEDYANKDEDVAHEE